jgi:hypothetical protein
MLISQPAKKRFSILAFCDYLFLFAFAVACFFVVIPSRICCCRCLFLCLSSRQGSAVAIAVVCFFVCHPVRDLLLLLPLSVSLSVIPSGICCCCCRCLFLCLSSRQGSAVAVAVACSCRQPDPERSQMGKDPEELNQPKPSSSAPLPLPVSLVCHPVRDLLLLLPVPAVILTLSEVEWGRIPKNSTSPDHPYFSTHNLLHLCRCLFL